MWKSFGSKYDRLYKIKEAIHNLSDIELNSISEKVLSIPPNKRSLASVFKAAVYKKPSLVIDVIRAFASV